MSSNEALPKLFSPGSDQQNMKYIALLLLLAAAANAGTQKSQGSSGRFQLVQLGSAARDKYLLDTDTGRIWQQTCVKGWRNNGLECDLVAWRWALVEGVNVTHEQLQDLGKDE